MREDSLSSLPVTPFSWSLEGPFEMILRPSRASNIGYYFAGVSDELGVVVPGHHQKQLTQTLIVRLMKMHLCTQILDFEKLTEYN